MSGGDAKVLEIIAHRGYSAHAPENTLAAIERAIAAGADAIEWDVHVAACGTPVVIHDETLERTTDGTGLVRERTLHQLRALDAGAWFAPPFAGERIPSLAEALERTRGRVARVYTEVKGYRDLDDVDRMVEVVRDAGRAADHVFISMDWRSLDRIAERDARAAIGYIVEARERFDEALERAASDPRALVDLDCRIVLAEPGVAVRALDRGVALAVWTVNDAASAGRLRDAGVTRFTTDRVEELIAWRAATA